MITSCKSCGDCIDSIDDLIIVTWFKTDGETTVTKQFCMNCYQIGRNPYGGIKV
jgi:hypothetical protein